MFIEVPLGVSKFGRAYISSYVYNSPYMIPLIRREQNVRPLHRPQIMEHTTDMSTSIDINPLRGLEDSSLFVEFDRWFASDITVDRRVQHLRSFFQIILGITLMGWLGDKVIIFFKFFECCGFLYKFYLLNRNVSVSLQHIHEYFCLISEKQR